MRFSSTWKNRLIRKNSSPNCRPPWRTFTPRLEVLEDRTVLSPYIVTTTADSGPGSLRDAINQVNADASHALYPSPSNSSVDEIDFNISAGSDTGGGFNVTTGVATITPTSALPTITNAVTLDAYTEPGASPNALSFGDNAVLKIVLDGSLAGAGSNGLTISATGCTIRGLVINGFDRFAIELIGSSPSGNVVAGNFIGTNADASAASPNGGGIEVRGSVLIGGTTAAARNIISGNHAWGIDIEDANSITIQGNYIGTDLTGSQAILNGYQGIALSANAFAITIGGTAAGAGNVILGGYIFGEAVEIAQDSHNNLVAGNLIGTDASGTRAFGLGGVVLSSGAHDNTIGGTTATARNIISGNALGVEIATSAYNNFVEGNYIGTDITGTIALPNYNDGVFIYTCASNNTIGGLVSGAGNLISGNAIGLEINGTGTAGNMVEGNLIGTNAAGTAALPNGGSGVLIDGGAANNTILGNVISASGLPPGIVSWWRADGNAFDSVSGNNGTLQGNVTFATGKSGQAFAFNALDQAVYVPSNQLNFGAGDFTIDAWVYSRSTGVRNPGVDNGNQLIVEKRVPFVSGFEFYKRFTGLLTLFVEGEGIVATGGLVTNNPWHHVAVTRIASTVTLYLDGAVVATGTSHANLDTTASWAIGGDPVAAQIANATPEGFDGFIDDTAAYRRGLSASEIQAIYNAGGGTKLASGNANGVELDSNTAGNVVQGNLIGTNAAGTAALGNSQYGVALNSASVNSIFNNTVSGNGSDGINVTGSGGATIQGNVIGTNAGGTGALANGGSGVHVVASSGNTIGGTASGVANVIANNQKAGVVIGSSAADTASIDNAIRGNSIHDNGGLGIDLGNDGVTLNDSQGHSGPNNFQDFPILTSAVTNKGGITIIAGSFSSPSQPNTSITVDFYANAAADPSGYGEGQIYLGSQTFKTNPNGTFTIPAFRPTMTVPLGYYVSATATNSAGDTSEFGPDVLNKSPGAGGPRGLLVNSSGTSGSGSTGGALVAEVLGVYVDNSTGSLSADELARVEDALASVNAVAGSYGASLTEVNSSAAADVTIQMSTTTALGGLADGVLGCEDSSGITLVEGWNFYAGSDPSAISSGQYDFQTVVTHELGHALGLGHSANAASVMYATLTAGTTNRALAVADLNVPDSDTGGACGLHASSAPGTEFSFGGLYTPPQPVPWGTPTRGEGEDRALGGPQSALSEPQSPLSVVLADWSTDTDFAGQASQLLGWRAEVREDPGPDAPRFPDRRADNR